MKINQELQKMLKECIDKSVKDAMADYSGLPSMDMNVKSMSIWGGCNDVIDDFNLIVATKSMELFSEAYGGLSQGTKLMFGNIPVVCIGMGYDTKNNDTYIQYIKYKKDGKIGKAQHYLSLYHREGELRHMTEEEESKYESLNAE